MVSSWNIKGVSEIEKMKPFPELWDMAKGLGTDLDERIEALYDACVKAKFPPEVIENLVITLYEVSALQHFTDENKADSNNIEVLEKRVRNHKHMPSGEAVELF